MLRPVAEDVDPNFERHDRASAEVARRAIEFKSERNTHEHIERFPEDDRDPGRGRSGGV
jgi:hypothetical protein